MGNEAQSPVRFENSHPILRVEDMAASLRFYVGLLGFKNAAWGTDGFTCVSRDQAAIYLCQGAQGRGGAWVKARGVPILRPPTNYPWALEMQVEDPDGNVLRLGSEPSVGQASRPVSSQEPPSAPDK